MPEAIREQQEYLEAALAGLGIPWNPTRTEILLRFAALVRAKNRQVSLTAITDPWEFIIKHLVDSLAGVLAFQLRAGMKVLDLGTGAGFPGVPLKIYQPGIELTLVDSVRKKTVVLEENLTALGIAAQVVNARAEEVGASSRWRESQDLVCARAVAPLNILAEYTLPLVAVGGSFLAYKGPEGETEKEAALGAIAKLGGEAGRVVQFKLPGAGDVRTLIRIEKTAPTPASLPRRPGRAKKQPLR